ncbi:MAG: hypothetical protein IT317_08970 [Anaerolineales bacterium]|nr:hypothetical protein [Anaerolineales bacterium]
MAPGIAPKDRPNLFDRFCGADTSRSRPGTGLGISIARLLAEAQSGALSVESDLGKGSTFTIRLPAA